MNEEKWVAWEIQTSRVWSDIESVLKYTNIDFIDHDHEILVEYALKLNQVSEKTENEFSVAIIEDTKKLLDDLFSFAKLHFDKEEQFMDLYGLPNSEVHKREHNKILTMLNDALDSYNSGKIKLTINLKSQVMEWLIKHINKFDYEFFEISNWSQNINNASGWKELKPIIRLTGINDIDNQHFELTDIAINAMRNISDYPLPEVIETECNRLLDYAYFHFSYEAEFMKKYYIKEPEKHLLEHGEFEKKVKQYSAYMIENIKYAKEMKDWLLTWWINHINTVDKDYFAFENWAYTLIDKAEKIEDVYVVLRRVGIKEIDDDHLLLMSYTFQLNKLIMANTKDNEISLESEETKNQILEMLEKIYSFAEGHFKNEESLMESRKTPDFDSHRLEHRKILSKLNGIRDNYISGRLYLSGHIKSMILEWWINHTNSTDYRTFVQNWNDTSINKDLEARKD